MVRMEIYTGTSGFSYKEWKGSFYPEKIKPDEMLSFYASKLGAVEINNTFYRMPKESVVEGWAGQTPEAFRFSIKASRRITHMKRLKDVDEEVGYLLRSIGALGVRLGVVLFQLPPNMKKDMDRLSAFLDVLPEATPAAFEFRHASWLEDDEMSTLLASRGVALVTADVDDAPTPELLSTPGIGYVRLRRTSYSDADLKAWVDRIAAQAWSSAFVFFKHEDEASGPAMAAAFHEAWSAR